MESEISVHIRNNVYLIRMLLFMILLIVFGDDLINLISLYLYSFLPLCYYNVTGILFLKDAYVITLNAYNFTFYFNETNILILNQTSVFGFANFSYLYFGTVGEFILERLLLH